MWDKEGGGGGGGGGKKMFCVADEVIYDQSHRHMHAFFIRCRLLLVLGLSFSSSFSAAG